MTPFANVGAPQPTRLPCYAGRLPAPSARQFVPGRRPNPWGRFRLSAALAFLVMVLVHSGTALAASLTPWSFVADFPALVAFPAVATDGGYLYVAGGTNYLGNPGSGVVSTFERYDPSTNSWTTLAPMLQGVFAGAATYSAVNKKIYVFGGYCCNKETAYTQIYDIATDTWAFGSAVPFGVSGMGAVYYPGTQKIYVLGGFSFSESTLSAANRIYDPLTDTWDTVSPTWIPTGMGLSAVGLDGHLIYLAGTSSLTTAQAVYRYDIVSNTWSQLADLPVPLWTAMGAAVGGKFYVVGGLTGSPATTSLATYIYDPGSNSWTTGPATNAGHGYTGGTAIGNRLFVVGGGDPNSALPINKVESALIQPTVTLKVNGQHPNPPLVHTSGPLMLTLDMDAAGYTAPLKWYWGFLVNGQVIWLTGSGPSTTPAPLVTAPPAVLTNATLLNISLPSGVTLTSFFLLVDSGGSLVSFDYISAARP